MAASYRYNRPMSEFAFVLSERFEDHNPGPDHPERPQRVRAVREAIDGVEAWRGIPRLPLTRVAREALLRVHDAEYLDRVARAAETAPALLDGGDTTLGTHSLEVASLAAGSLLDLVTRVWKGEFKRGFAAVRPPGHHAERDRAMGFCIYNNIAVAAAGLRALGVERVMIVDWDVHHGNGTQHIFEDDPNVLFVSVHQSPLYPGTGARDERGLGAGQGATCNFPLRPGSGDIEFLAALEVRMAEVVTNFRPQFVLISAGFDAHIRDPLANLEVTTPAFGVAARCLRQYAERHSSGRIVSVLEGGYDLTALAEGTIAHLQELIPENS